MPSLATSTTRQRSATPIQMRNVRRASGSASARQRGKNRLVQWTTLEVGPERSTIYGQAIKPGRERQRRTRSPVSRSKLKSLGLAVLAGSLRFRHIDVDADSDERRHISRLLVCGTVSIRMPPSFFSFVDKCRWENELLPVVSSDLANGFCDRDSAREQARFAMLRGQPHASLDQCQAHVGPSKERTSHLLPCRPRPPV